MSSIADYLQILNYKGNASFETWLQEYKSHVGYIFEIFRSNLYPNVKNITEELWLEFAQYLYKKSSKVV